MAFEKLQDRLHRRLGEAIFLTAQKELLKPRDGISPELLVCQILATLILLLPLLVGAFGLWLIIGAFPAWLGMVIGGLFLCLAYALLPRIPRNMEKTFTAQEMPELFRLLSEVSAALRTRVPDGVHLLSDVNAYAAEFGLQHRTRILGIGMPLWLGLTEQERVALISHEMAHFVNNDPARGKLLHLALQTVAAWDYFLAPDDFVMGRSLTEIVSDLIQNLLRAPVLFAGYVLTRLHFRSSQQAEYLADAFAVPVSGADAMVGVLRKTMLGELMEGAKTALYPFGDPQNRRIFDVMGAAIRSPDKDKEAAELTKMEQQKLRVDATHPPSIYRIAFVEMVDEATPKVTAAAFDFDLIDQEMHDEADRLGARLMQSLEEQ